MLRCGGLQNSLGAWSGVEHVDAINLMGVVRVGSSVIAGMDELQDVIIKLPGC